MDCTSANSLIFLVLQQLLKCACAASVAQAERMPSYKFNNFTGRLKESTHFQPLYPISAARLESSEPPKMIYDTIKTKPVAVSSNTRAKSGGVLPEKMLKTFEAYQKDLDYPVYKIRGTPDKILFGISVALVGVCTCMSLRFIYTQAFPPKQQ